jgi:membrane-associated phospholipid phosphatase
VSSRLTGAVCAVLWLAGHAAPAAAQDAPGVEADLATDGTITGVALLGSALLTLYPVDLDSSWDSELFGGLDRGVRANYSASAAKLSDAMLVVAIVTPAALNLGGELDDAAGDRLLIYGESLAVNGLFSSVAKYLVQRPRPYTYNPDPMIEAFEREQGKDSRLSFYSGHAALSFGAAVTGAYLYGLSAPDEHARAVVWGFTLATATATANLRVLAGKHYYSDVVVGAVVGAGIGYLVPALHADGDVYTPSGVEIAAMVGGVLVGALGSQFLPLHDDVLVPLHGKPALRVQLVPFAFSGGGGLGAMGTF